MLRIVLPVICLFAASSSSFNRRGLQQSENKDGKSLVGIIGGREVTPHSHPYMVYIKSNAECQGFILSEEWVVTIAQCVYKAEVATLVFGAHDLTVDEREQVIIHSENFTIHEDFSADYFFNDIALIRLTNPLAFTSAIQPAKLPTFMMEPGQIGVITGWGLTSQYNTYYSNVLTEGKVTISPNKSCADYYQTSTPHTICVMTGNHSQAFCDGDFGSSLYYEGAVHGLASYYSSQGCDSDGGDVYTRVYDFVDWIKSKTGLNVQ